MVRRQLAKPTEKPQRRNAAASARPEPRIISEQKQAAELLGVTDRQLRNWRSEEPDFPDCSGGYDIDAIRAWRDEHGRKNSKEADQARQLNLARRAQELRIKKAEADRREREEEIAKGNILPRDEYTLAVREIVQLTRDQLKDLPKELARAVPKKNRRRYLAEATRGVLKILDNMGRMLEAGPEKNH